MENQQAERYFAEQLLPWFRENKRDLPWRKNKNPYYVWVSEVMLQQTRVDTVIPYFNRFIERFPTLDALAEADEEEVLKCWEGLGYYSRARNLHQAVKDVKQRYGSVIPNEREQIMSLKGVGSYTAGAILSIAYGLPEPAVDGNVMRVLSRYFLITDDISKARTRVQMEERLRRIIPKEHAGDFTESMMELGALICTPRSPDCINCPIHLHCAAKRAGVVESLPIKMRAKPPRPEKRVVAWIQIGDEENRQFLIRKRPEQGLLANMWELPNYSLSSGFPLAPESDLHRQNDRNDEIDRMYGESLRRSLLHEDGIRVQPGERIMETTHTFSHLHWELYVYQCSLSSDMSDRSMDEADARYRWIRYDEIESYVFPNAFLKIIEQVAEKVEYMIDERKNRKIKRNNLSQK